MNFTTNNGYTVYYEVYGDGPVLMLLNGIMMSTKSWHPFIDAFSKEHTLVLVDFLDQGQSDRLDFEYKHTLQVEMVHELIEHLNLENITLFGISYGGEIALQVALNNPVYLKKLLLFNTTAWTSPWLQDIGDGWNAASKDPEAYYGATIPVIYSSQFYNESSAWMMSRKEYLLGVFASKQFIEGMRRLTNSSVGYDVRERLDQVLLPTLVVSSEYDFVTPKHEQEYLVQNMKNVQYVMIPQCGHASMYEKPELFVALVLGYMDEPATGYTL